MVTQSFINLFDHVGITPQLYYNNQPRYTSCVGAITTIAVSLSIGAFILYFFVIFIIGDGMTVVFTKDSLQEDLKYNIDQHLFLIRIHDLSGKTIDPRIATIKSMIWKYNSSDLQVDSIAVERCSFVRTVNRDTYDKFNKKINISDFHCISPNQEVGISISKDGLSGSYLYFYLVKCNNATEQNTCLAEKEINDYLNNTTFYIAMNYESVMIDHYKDEPILQTDIINSEMISTSLNYDLTLYWRGVKYISDTGWLFNIENEINVFEFDTTYNQIMIHKNADKYSLPGTFTSIKLAIHPYSSDIYHRSYSKLQSIIANIGGLMKVIMLIGDIVVYVFLKGQYYCDLFMAISSIDTEDNGKRRGTHERIRFNNLSLDKSLNHLKTKPKKIEIPKKINCLHSIQWMLCPKLNSSTVYISICEKKISEYLSVNNILEKLLLIDLSNEKVEKLNNKGNEVFETNKSEILFNKRIPIKSICKSKVVIESFEVV